YSNVGAALLDGGRVGLVTTSPVGIARVVSPRGPLAYWASERNISRHAVDQGLCTTNCEALVVSHPQRIVSIAGDDAGVFFTSVSDQEPGDGGVWLRAEGAAAAVTIAPSWYPSTLAVADRVYFGDDNGIYAVDKDGKNLALLVPERSMGLAVRGDR